LHPSGFLGATGPPSVTTVTRTQPSPSNRHSHLHAFPPPSRHPKSWLSPLECWLFNETLPTPIARLSFFNRNASPSWRRPPRIRAAANATAFFSNSCTNTGARVSENCRPQSAGYSIQPLRAALLRGKGRKQRNRAVVEVHRRLFERLAGPKSGPATGPALHQSFRPAARPLRH